MASDFVKWAADEIYESVKAEKCEDVFLRDLREHPKSLMRTITEDIKDLTTLYIMGKNKIVYLDTDSSDPNCFATCAKDIVSYMRDDMLKKEMMQIR